MRPPTSLSTYRADIDGLRAVAVLSVVLYHARVAGFPGGFVGVDVFFVISGFLITRLILPEVDEGIFSIVGFYERRIRRLLPALVFALLLCIAGSIVLDTPNSLADFGSSLIGVATFVSNVVFWRDIGYFASPAASKPLLHTWSLSVEEQFYILYPLFLLTIARWGGRRYTRWLWLSAALSLGASAYVTSTHTVAAFYLAPFRAWELLIGALLAVRPIPFVTVHWIRTGIAVTGLGMIIAAVGCFTERTPFPGLWALLPTVGAGMVIFAGLDGETAVSRLLGLRPLVFVGLISYSLYLLHWPVLLFARQSAIVELSGWETALTLGVAFLFAVLSWHFIERPFRRQVNEQQRRVFLCAATLLGVFAFTGIALRVSHGLPQRFARAPFAPDIGVDSVWAGWNRCERRYPPEPSLRCRLGSPNGAQSFALWGDSHALALASGVSAGARDAALSGVLLVANGCPPIIGVKRVYDDGVVECADENNRAIKYIEGHPELHTVLLAGRWSLYWSGRPSGESGERVKLQEVASSAPVGMTNAMVATRGFERTVRRLTMLGKRVIILGPVPEIGYDLPIAAQSAYLTGRNVESIVAPSTSDFLMRSEPVLALFAAEGSAYGADVVLLHHQMCDSTICHVVAKGRLLYRDDDHLSTFGSERLAPLFAKVLSRAEMSR